MFVDIATAEPISPAVRDRIRRRAAAWDGLPPHPDLGFYGDPGNLEWKQYCLPDDNMPATGTCPFLADMRKRHAPCPPP